MNKYTYDLIEKCMQMQMCCMCKQVSRAICSFFLFSIIVFFCLWNQYKHIFHHLLGKSVTNETAAKSQNKLANQINKKLKRFFVRINTVKSPRNYLTQEIFTGKTFNWIRREIDAEISHFRLKYKEMKRGLYEQSSYIAVESSIKIMFYNKSIKSNRFSFILRLIRNV